MEESSQGIPELFNRENKKVKAKEIEKLTQGLQELQPGIGVIMPVAHKSIIGSLIWGSQERVTRPARVDREGYHIREARDLERGNVGARKG